MNKMVKETKEEKVIEQPTQQTIEDVSTEKLKAAAFDIGDQIKVLQRQYNQIYNELVKRAQEKKQ